MSMHRYFRQTLRFSYADYWNEQFHQSRDETKKKSSPFTKQTLPCTDTYNLLSQQCDRRHVTVVIVHRPANVCLEIGCNTWTDENKFLESQVNISNKIFFENNLDSVM